MLDKMNADTWCKSDLQSDLTNRVPSPISTLRLSLSTCHRCLRSGPTTLSTKAESVALVSSGLHFARRFTQSILGHDTLSRVPSSIAKVQHELRQGWQLM